MTPHLRATGRIPARPHLPVPGMAIHPRRAPAVPPRHHPRNTTHNITDQYPRPHDHSTAGTPHRQRTPHPTRMAHPRRQRRHCARPDRLPTQTLTARPISKHRCPRLRSRTCIADTPAPPSLTGSIGGPLPHKVCSGDARLATSLPWHYSESKRLLKRRPRGHAHRRGEPPDRAAIPLSQSGPDDIAREFEGEYIRGASVRGRLGRAHSRNSPTTPIGRQCIQDPRSLSTSESRLPWAAHGHHVCYSQANRETAPRAAAITNPKLSSTTQCLLT